MACRDCFDPVGICLLVTGKCHQTTVETCCLGSLSLESLYQMMTEAAGERQTYTNFKIIGWWQSFLETFQFLLHLFKHIVSCCSSSNMRAPHTACFSLARACSPGGSGKGCQLRDIQGQAHHFSPDLAAGSSGPIRDRPRQTAGRGAHGSSGCGWFWRG